jgi:hypothetical protein
MECHEVQKRLYEFAEGALPEPLAADFRDHLAHCSGCSRIYRGIHSLETAIGQVRQNAPDPFAATRLLAFLEKQQEQKGVRRFNLATLVLRPSFLVILLGMTLVTGIFAARALVANRERTTAAHALNELRTEMHIAVLTDEEIRLNDN